MFCDGGIDPNAHLCELHFQNPPLGASSTGPKTALTESASISIYLLGFI
jgi:hypothetical protein